ncbi:kelch-like protein 24 [Amphiura filiformis]|uniref:kelch-like protein 24 n=1 Tax=Amphiura filiformis TaxID=82378 RepID=UPI003B2102C0
MEQNCNHGNASEYTLYEPERSEDVMSALNKMRKKGHLTDVTIEARGEVFPCHRAVLACSSEYFKAMFSCNLKESSKGVVTMNDIDPQILHLLIDYAYTSSISINTVNAQTLLEISNRLQFANITQACCKFLQDHLDPTNCLGIWQLASTHSCNDLARSSFRYCLARFQEVCQLDEFFQLPANQLEEYLSHDALVVGCEEIVYHALLAWILHNDNRKCYLEKLLLRTVRPLYLSTNFLLRQLESFIIKQSLQCYDQLHMAITQQKLYVQSQTYIDRPKPRLSTMSDVMVIVGGSGSNHSEERDVRYYNPASETWRSLSSLPKGMSGYSVAVLENDIYVTGGKQERAVSSCILRYSSSTDTWSSLPDMRSPRQFHGSVVCDGMLYVVGGENAGKLQRDVERFDPKTNIWETVTQLACAVSSPAVVTHKGKLYIIGGYTSDLLSYPCIQCYDVKTNKWKVTAAVQINSRHFPAVVIGNLIYILDCYGQRGIQVYDPDRDVCLTPVSMKSERHLFAAVALNNKIYVAGGMQNFLPLDTIQVFDPLTAKWKNAGRMPRALRAHSCGVTIKKYLGPPFNG